jgi:F-type H+-transporting ATPase subunit b
MSFLEDAHFWEATGLVLLIVGLIWAKVPQIGLTALDDRANRIRAQLAEATRLREEAERLLAEIKQQREASERQAGEILDLARKEAERLGVESRARLEEHIKRRGEQAERRIALAEAQAAQEVRAAAAELAAQASEAVLAARLAETRSDPLVDAAIGRIAEKLR